MKSRKCKFNKDNLCYAMACYDAKECSAKDEHGIPKYQATTQSFVVKKVRR